MVVTIHVTRKPFARPESISPLAAPDVTTIHTASQEESEMVSGHATGFLFRCTIVAARMQGLIPCV